MHRDFGLYHVRLIIGWLLGAMALHPITADAQNATAPAVVVAQAENTGQDFLRPLNMFQLRYEYETAPGSGSEKGTISTVTSDIVTLRADHRIDLSPQWAVGLRADLPFLAKDPISSDNPSGNYVYGVGDADFQAALIHEFNARWVAGFGARLFAPTGGDVLGTGKWQIMPGAAVRYALFEVGPGSYFEPFWRYEVSFAGDPSKKNISNLQFAPTLNSAFRTTGSSRSIPAMISGLTTATPSPARPDGCFFHSISWSAAS